MTDTSPHADLVAALGALTEVPKSGKVNAAQRRYTFMKLDDLLTEVRRTFKGHNLAVTQHVRNHEHGISVETRILHTSGHVFEAPPLVLRCGADPQSIGATITYGRRYQLAALVGLAGEEDNDAADVAPPPPPPPKPPKPDNRPAPQPDHRGGQVSPGTASDKSVRAMWAKLWETGMDEASIRGWVGEVLSIDPDWHSAPNKDGTIKPNTLSQSQVSQVIERLKREIPPAQDE